jgi:hypothetical protein
VDPPCNAVSGGSFSTRVIYKTGIRFWNLVYVCSVCEPVHSCTLSQSIFIMEYEIMFKIRRNYEMALEKTDTPIWNNVWRLFTYKRFSTLDLDNSRN